MGISYISDKSVKVIKNSVKKSFKKVLKRTKNSTTKKTLKDNLNETLTKIDLIEEIDLDNLDIEKTFHDIAPSDYESVLNMLRGKLKETNERRILSLKRKERENDCKVRNYWNCEKPDNACELKGRLFEKKCAFSPKLNIELNDYLENRKVTIICPPGTFTRYYRKQAYCSKNKKKMTLIEYLRFCIGFIGWGYVIRVFTIIPEIIHNIRQTGFLNYLKKTFKDNLKGILVGSIVSLQTLLIAYYCGSFEYVPSKRLFGDIGTKNKKLMDNFIKPYIRGLKSLGRNHFAALCGADGGNIGADEEITFRKYFQKILEDNLKFPIEKSLEKMFTLFKTNKIEQKISMIYLFIESTLNGIVFGLAHLQNMRFYGEEETYCQVVFTTLLGFQLNIIQRYSNDLSLCWQIHYWHNFINPHMVYF